MWRNAGVIFLDLIGRYLVLFEVHLAFAYDPPNFRDAVGGSLRGQCERLAAGKSVVEQRGVLTWLGPRSVESADEYYRPGTQVN